MRCIATIAAVLALHLIAAPSSLAESFKPDRADRAAAIKEGNVSWYTSTPFPLVAPKAPIRAASTTAKTCRTRR